MDVHAHVFGVDGDNDSVPYDEEQDRSEERRAPHR